MKNSKLRSQFECVPYSCVVVPYRLSTFHVFFCYLLLRRDIRAPGTSGCHVILNIVNMFNRCEAAPIIKSCVFYYQSRRSCPLSQSTAQPLSLDCRQSLQRGSSLLCKHWLSGISSGCRPTRLYPISLSSSLARVLYVTGNHPPPITCRVSHLERERDDWHEVWDGKWSVGYLSHTTHEPTRKKERSGSLVGRQVFRSVNAWSQFMNERERPVDWLILVASTWTPALIVEHAWLYDWSGFAAIEHVNDIHWCAYHVTSAGTGSPRQYLCEAASSRKTHERYLVDKVLQHNCMPARIQTVSGVLNFSQVKLQTRCGWSLIIIIGA